MRFVLRYFVCGVYYFKHIDIDGEEQNYLNQFQSLLIRPFILWVALFFDDSIEGVINKIYYLCGTCNNYNYNVFAFKKNIQLHIELINL